MTRIITIVSAVLLSTSSIVHAEDSGDFLLDNGVEPNQWGSKQQQWHRVDVNMPAHEYESVASQNQRIVKNALRSYSNDMLQLVGISERGASLIGATASGLATRGARLSLNRSETIILEFKDVDDSTRSLYFGVSMDW